MEDLILILNLHFHFILSMYNRHTGCPKKNALSESLSSKLTPWEIRFKFISYKTFNKRKMMCVRKQLETQSVILVPSLVMTKVMTMTIVKGTNRGNLPKEAHGSCANCTVLCFQESSSSAPSSSRSPWRASSSTSLATAADRAQSTDGHQF